MGFSLSGTTITQSGTDTNLAGLSAIAGVTTTTISVGGNTRTTYDARTRNIAINGVLNHNPETEELIINTVSGSGTYNYGGTLTSFGMNRPSTKNGLTITQQSSHHYVQPALSGLSLTKNFSGGHITTYGGHLDYRGAGSLKDITIHSIVPSANGVLPLVRVNETIIVDTLVTIGCGLWNRDAVASLNAYTPLTEAVTFDSLYKQGGNTVKDVANAVLGGADNKITVLRGSRINMVNTDIGSDTVVTFGDSANSEPRDGGVDSTVMFSKQIQFKLANADGNNIESATIYLKDTNNGNRTNALGETDNLLLDKVYNLTTDANGTTSVAQILTAFKYPNQPYNATAPLSSKIGEDFRDESNSSSAMFTFKAIQYLYNILALNTALTGNDILEVNRSMVTDLSVTETNKATVDAYSQIETAQAFYDRAKSYLSDNYSGETSTIVTRVGDAIYCDFNIVINKTASSAFAFDGATITIKADTCSSDLILPSNKTVTLLNGAIASGTVVDANSNSSLSFTGISNWKLYGSEANRDSNTSVIASGAVSENFRFSYSAGTSYYARLTTGDETIFKTITPTQSGGTLVDLSQAGLLAVLPMNIDATIANQLDGINLPLIIRNELETTTVLAKKTDIEAINTGGGSGGGLDESSLHSALDSYSNKDDFKASSTTVDLTPVTTAIANLNDFNPLSDTVARVTLVDTTTTNTDMRGTDGANEVAPNNEQFKASDRAKLESLDNYDDTALVTKVDAVPTAAENATATLTGVEF